MPDHHRAHRIDVCTPPIVTRFEARLSNAFDLSDPCRRLVRAQGWTAQTPSPNPIPIKHWTQSVCRFAALTNGDDSSLVTGALSCCSSRKVHRLLVRQAGNNPI